MLRKLLDFILENRVFVLIAFIFIFAVGIYSLMKTPVDAIPDLSENQVIVFTEWQGQNPQNIEDLVTYPLSSQLQGLAGVKDVRASSMVGFSAISVIFEENIDLYFARDRVSERLSLAQKDLPQGVTPVIGPDATGVGHVFMYQITSEDKTLTELRSLQDYVVKYALSTVPGVAEVASMGGYIKEYKVILNPLKMKLFDLEPSDVVWAIKNSNANVTGKVVEKGEEEIFVQGVGFLEKSEDIENVVLGGHHEGITLRVADVANVVEGSSFRRTILADDQGETVGGVVVMRFGENPLEVIKGVNEKIEEIQTALPEGVVIESFYDRTSLIWASIKTLMKTLAEAIVIVTLVALLFFGSLRAGMIISLSLIMGVIMTFIFMKLWGVPSNIMSLGGIAIGIGMMIDAAIVMSENAAKSLAEKKPKSLDEKIAIVRKATLEVLGPIIFSVIIIVLAFIPVFALTGMEGKMFTPLAFTKTFAMIGALITSVFLVPALCVWLLPLNFKKEEDNKFVAFFHRIYKPILNWALNKKKAVLILSTILLSLGFYSATFVGNEFMPPLDEMSIMYMPISVPDVSESKMQEYLITTNKIISSFPEVEKVVGKAGRAETATDPAPLPMIETFITLKPKKAWRKGLSKEELITEMNRKMKLDNLWNSFTQPIIGRIDMISTGIRTELGLKIYGDDLFKLEELAIRAEDVLWGVSGASDVTAIRTTGLEYYTVDLDDKKLAQYGVPKKKALDALSIGVGGMTVTHSLEGRERYPIQVRMNRLYRENVDDVGSIMVKGFSGQEVPLSSLGKIDKVDGPSVINSEEGNLRSLVQLNVKGRDMGSFIEDAREVIDQELNLPAGYYVEWDGQYKHQQSAKKKLTMIVPVVILMIFLLLYLTYKDLKLASIVLVSIPFSLVGGIFSILFTGYNFSVAVWVGMIALFAVSVETSIVMVVYIENAYRRKAGLPLMEGEDEEILEVLPKKKVSEKEIREAVVEGAMYRLRPKLMTSATTIIGLLPVVLSSGVGSEVQKPLATVLIGSLSSFDLLVTLVVIPALFEWVKVRELKSKLIKN